MLTVIAATGAATPPALPVPTMRLAAVAHTIHATHAAPAMHAVHAAHAVAAHVTAAGTVQSGALTVLAAAGAWLLNHLTTALVVVIVGYLVRLERAYGPRLVAWAIATANTLLALHLSAQRQRDLATAVQSHVLAAQMTFTLPQDRHDAVVTAITGHLPGVDTTRLDTNIDAAIACLKLQHGADAWAGLVPSADTEAAPHTDIDAATTSAREEGRQAGYAQGTSDALAEFLGRLQGIGVSLTPSSAASATPAPQTPPVEPTHPADQLPIVEPSPGATVRIVTQPTAPRTQTAPIQTPSVAAETPAPAGDPFAPLPTL